MKKTIENLKYPIISFFITGIIITFIFIIGGFVPFGNRSLACMDANIQYLDFFAYLKDVLQGNNSINYTFSKMLGGCNIGLLSYYLMSPLNFFVIFFDKAELHVFFNLIVLLKLCFASSTMAYFIEHRFTLIPKTMIISLSTAYGLMHYNVTQASNIMWLDGVIMLPLIIYGVYILVNQNKYFLLIISVFLSIIFNWYSAGINCLFSIFWCAYELLLKYKISKNNLKYIFITIGKYILSMATGVLLSSIIFLPTIFGLLAGKGQTDASYFNFELLESPYNVIQGFMIGSISKEGYVSLFCGSIVLIASCLYFFNSCESKRRRLISFLFLIFIILLFYWKPLIFLFSLLRETKSYWYRYSYVAIFYLIYLSGEYFNKEILKKNIWIKIFSVFFVLISLWVWMDYKDLSFDKKLYYSVILLLISSIFFFLKIKKRYELISVVLCIELSFNALLCMNHYSTNEVDQYEEYVSMQEKMVNSVKDMDNSFYRMNQTSTRRMQDYRITANYNEGMAFNYYSISSYTSTLDKNQNDFLDKLGYRAYSSTFNIVNTSFLPADSLLGVKYIMSDYEINGYERIENIGFKNKSLYKNPYTLPIAFKYRSSKTKKIVYTQPFEYINKLYSNLLGRNVKILRKVDINKKHIGKQIVYTIPRLKKTESLYAFFEYPHDTEAKLVCNDSVLTSYSNRLSPKIVYIPHNASKSSIVKIQGKKKLSSKYKEYFYVLDLNEFQNIIKELNSQSIDDIIIRNGYISCEVNASNDENLFLSIADDFGWKIKLNGDTVQAENIGDCLISIPLKEGKNKIEMVYEVPGLELGTLITIITLLGCYFVLYKKRNNNKVIQIHN